MTDTLCAHMPDAAMDMEFDRPISRWDEAIPLGNGLLGCLVWGDGAPLRMSVDRVDLWDTRAAPEILAPDYTYKELISLVRNGDQDAILKRFDTFYARPTPTKIPAGKLLLNFGMPCDSMHAHLKLHGATAEIHAVFGGASVCIRTFVHAMQPCGYIESTGGILPRLQVQAPPYNPDAGNAGKHRVSKREGLYGGLEQLGYPPHSMLEGDDLVGFIQPMCDGQSYAFIAAHSRDQGGHMRIAYTVARSQEGVPWLENAVSLVRRAAAESLPDVLYAHEAWWQRFWTKSALSLPELDFQRQWYVTNDLFGSCSREEYPPMPLQGVWTADDGGLPPWKGDYHGDLNIQMSYWHYMKANHMPEGRALVNLLWKLLPQAERFARAFFDAPGICLPSVMSLDGIPLGGWPMYCTNLVNQIWLCQAFDHIWQYGRDVDFLRERAYPYLRMTAQCVLHWLEPDDNGFYKLPLSSSPEIHHNSMAAWLTPNSNNDLALLIYLFRTLASMADVLNNGEAQDWRSIETKLPPLAVGARGELMLSPDETLSESHRHLSHAMAIYPLDLLQYDNPEHKRVIDATIQALELLGAGLWAGHTYIWMSCLYARQRNGNGAYWQLKVFWETMCAPNGFCMNTDYMRHGVSSMHHRPFTLETNMAAANALQEMLLQTCHGVIRVFPAIPDRWKRQELSFEGFLGEGGVEIGARYANGAARSLSVKALVTGVFRIENSFDADVLAVDAQGESRSLRCAPGAIFEIMLHKGQICRITALEGSDAQ